MLKYGRYSFSKISLWDQCPFKFYIHYVLRPDAKKISSFYLDKGNLVHGVIESLLKDELQSYSIPTYEYLTSKNKKEIFASILNFCSFKKFKEIKEQSNKSIEETFYLDIHMNPCEKKDAALKGKIDIFYPYDNQVWIYDWKTTGSTLEKIKKWPKSADQLEVYALWAMQKYGYDEAICHFAYVDVNYYDKKIFTKDDIPELKEKWYHKIDAIEDCEDFHKKKSRLCDYCDIKEFCDVHSSIEEAIYFDSMFCEFDEIPY